MPTLNVRLTAILMISLVIAGGGVHLLHGYQVGRKAQALKDTSKKYEDDSNGEMKKARGRHRPGREEGRPKRRRKGLARGHSADA